MTEAEFQKLLKNDRYQVFLFACPAWIPFNFAIHPWFVIYRGGVASRWEVGFGLQKREKSWGHLDLDILPPYKGIQMGMFINRLWKAWLISSVEGDGHSVAARMADFIISSPQIYPYREKYSLAGPNSNTYVQWILNKFPESGMHLPWNAIGKNFKVVDKAD